MRLDAHCMSDYAAARQSAFAAAGRVHSVFSRSANVEFDGFLLHIGPADAPLSCLGLTVEPNGASALARLATPGDLASFRDGSLRIYARGGTAAIDTGAALVRGMAVPAASTGVILAGDALVHEALPKLDLAARIGLPWDERAVRSLTGLARLSAVCRDAWDAHRASAPAPHRRFEAAMRDVRCAVLHLLGRGLGLTPSGDDILCGFGCGLRYLWGAHPIVQEGWRGYTQAVLDALPGRTTAVSEAYLRAMCDGFANEDHLEMLRALEALDSRALDASMARVLQVGHTSGPDSLLGFAAAFCCLL